MFTHTFIYSVTTVCTHVHNYTCTIIDTFIVRLAAHTNINTYKHTTTQAYIHYIHTQYIHTHMQAQNIGKQRKIK